MSAAERLRLRELAKYYAVANVRAKFARHAPDTRANSVQNDLDINDLKKLNTFPAKDRQLTALAQLATFKLGYQRCFVSIIDDIYQHFIAEATSTTALTPRDAQKQHEALLVGVQSVLLEQMWLPTTYTCQQNYIHLEDSPGQSIYTKDGIVIRDLASHKARENSNLVQAFPDDFRAYLEVPLLTTSGYVFGSICVVNNIEKDTQESDLDLLRDIAALMVEHLDILRVKADFNRAQRLLEGLAHFIDGKQSLSVWSSETADQDLIPAIEADSQDLSSIKSQATSYDLPLSRSQSFAGSEPSTRSPLLSTQYSASTYPQHSTPITSTATGSNVFGDNVARPPEDYNDPLVSTNAPENIGIQIRSTTTASVAEAFARASNLIRECMNLEATCFLEVPHNERAQLTNRSRTTKISEEGEVTTAEKGPDASSESSSEVTTPEEFPHVSSDRVVCHRLAFSTASKSSLARSYATTKFMSIPATVLKLLASRYPRGRIFHFDSRGGISSGEDSTESSSQSNVPRSKPRMKKRGISQRLFKWFPDARSLVFVPLYDSDRQHVFAGFIGWTASVTRAIQVHEVTFIKGFVDSVMCEVQRLEAMSMDKAKSDFIASISHELRTPLHGILASAQLLADGEKFEHQTEFISMIDISGRTLLDVMDHLLDHAKINHFTQGKASALVQGQPKLMDKSNQTFSLVSQVNIADILEETAASVAASDNQLNKRRRHSVSSETVDSDAIAVPIILDIEKQDRWSFQTESGSWRRIIMNLVGNALKYTTEGHVTVTLSLKKQQASMELLTKYLVELKFTDTGQGISEEYLKHRLFTAFAQEDNLSVGTGLGLSLVNKIVSTLKGKIKVHSEVDQGTEIVVRIPLIVSNDMPIKQSLDIDSIMPLKGRSVAISGFAKAPGVPTGVIEPQVAALLALKKSLASIVTDWLAMEIVVTNAEIEIVEHSHLEQHQDLYDQAKKRVLVISTSGLHSSKTILKKASYACVVTPVGPTRLTKAVLSLLAQVKPETQDLATRNSNDKKSDTHKTQLILNSRLSTFSTLQLTDEINTRCREEQSRPTTPSNRPYQGRTFSNKTSSAQSLPLSADSFVPTRTVLLVDDNDINLRILVIFVHRMKAFEILTATNGQEAVDTFISSTEGGKEISFIFMDINMPVMDGFAATRSIRQYEKNRKPETAATKILALTGLASEESQRRIEASSFDGYYRKPLSLTQLQKILS